MSGFFQTLNYSSCNEDWETEREALRIGATDRIVCITGSGDRPLNLLLAEPAQVCAVDANPAQGMCMSLKVAAIQALPYEEYRDFLVTGRGYSRVAEYLRPEAREYWGARAEMLARGVLYEGRWERHYRALARAARLLRGGVIDGLFAQTDLEEQRRFVRERWDTRGWRLTYRLLCSRLFSRVFFGDPAFFKHVDPSMTVGDYVYDRMLGSLQRRLARRNFMMSLLFRGALSEEDLPPYLTREGHARLRALLPRLELHTVRLDSFLRNSAPGAFTRFSLSDVPSYLDAEQLGSCLAAMVHAAASEARFCIRQFLTAHEVPTPWLGRLAREPELERELELRDRAFAYRFWVGTVRS